MRWASGHTRMGERSENLSLMSVLSTSPSVEGFHSIQNPEENLETSLNKLLFSTTHSPTFPEAACQVFFLDCWFQTLSVCVCVCGLVSQMFTCKSVSGLWRTRFNRGAVLHIQPATELFSLMNHWVTTLLFRSLPRSSSLTAIHYLNIWQRKKTTKNNLDIFKLNKPAVNSMFSLHFDSHIHSMLGSFIWSVSFLSS